MAPIFVVLIAILALINYLKGRVGMDKNRIKDVAYILFRWVLTAVSIVLRFIVHCIDDWASTVDTKSSIVDRVYCLPQNTIHHYPYGADLLGAPRERKGQFTTNDILVIFDDV